MSSRGALAVLVGIALAGALAALVVAATDRPRLAFADTVPPLVAGVIRPGDELCQHQVDAVEPFDAVELRYATLHRPRPRLRTTVYRTRGRLLASGTQGAGGEGAGAVAVPISPRVPAGGFIDVCFQNAGATPVAVYGAPTSFGRLGYATFRRAGARSPARLRSHVYLRFLNAHPRTVLSQLPAVFRRAALLRPGFVGAWTFWVLLAAFAAGVPALLAYAVLRAGRDAN